MKAVFIIVFFITLSIGMEGQCKYGDIDTIPLGFKIEQGTGVWDYYNKGGSLAWGGVKEYDSTLIPKNGYAIQRTKQVKINGFGVFKTTHPEYCQMDLMDVLDLKKKSVPGTVTAIIGRF